MYRKVIVTISNTNCISKFYRKAARELRGSEMPSPSKVKEDRLQKLKSDLGQCNRRYKSLLAKIQELMADEQALTKMV